MMIATYLLWAERLVAAVVVMVLAYQAAFFLLGAFGVREVDSDPLLWAALGCLCALPGGALLWFAAGRRFGVWDDPS